MVYALFYSCCKRKWQILLKHVICQIIFPCLFNETQSPQRNVKVLQFACVPLSHNSFHIDHKVLPISLLSISKISPLFCILTAQDGISFSFGSLESLLSLHPASSFPIPFALYILVRIALDVLDALHWLYDLVLPNSIFIAVSPLCIHCYLLKYLPFTDHTLFSHTLLFSLFVASWSPYSSLPSNSCLSFIILQHFTFIKSFVLFFSEFTPFPMFSQTRSCLYLP